MVTFHGSFMENCASVSNKNVIILYLKHLANKWIELIYIFTIKEKSITVLLIHASICLRHRHVDNEMSDNMFDFVVLRQLIWSKSIQPDIQSVYMLLRIELHQFVFAFYIQMRCFICLFCIVSREERVFTRNHKPINNAYI